MAKKKKPIVKAVITKRIGSREEPLFEKGDVVFGHVTSDGDLTLARHRCPDWAIARGYWRPFKILSKDEIASRAKTRQA